MVSASSSLVAHDCLIDEVGVSFCCLECEIGLRQGRKSAIESASALGCTPHELIASLRTARFFPALAGAHLRTSAVSSVFNAETLGW